MSEPDEPLEHDSDSIIDLRDEVVDLQTRLAASEARFNNIVERSTDGMLVVDSRGVVLFANPAATAMLSRSKEDLIGREVGFALVAGDVSEIELIRPGREVIHAEMRVVESEWDEQPCRLALLRDTTKRHEVEVELAVRATHDPLTGLPNRYLLQDRLTLALARLSRGSGCLAVFIADLDDFKPVNDRFGHLVGDAVLIETARRIRSLLRPFDSPARLGGDEFALVCESMDADEAGAIVERLETAFEAPMHVSGRAITVGLSVGFALTDNAACTAESVLNVADKAMYSRKRGKRRAGTRS